MSLGECSTGPVHWFLARWPSGVRVHVRAAWLCDDERNYGTKIGLTAWLVEASMHDRFLPRVPRKQIEDIYNTTPGKEIASGKFDSPESSAALTANTFGFFLNQRGDLPPLPGCEDVEWPPSSLALEKKVSLPWRGGTHPVLDVLIPTSSSLIGIESKRFEPFRDKPEAHFSDAYWRDVWGDCMSGYQGIRDALRDNGSLYVSLKADQLVKHALGLLTRTSVPFRKFAT